jgi:presequence protease
MSNEFRLVRNVAIDSLNLEYQEYTHATTGATHIHFASEDTNNAFLVAFLTVPQDSSGVAHILEHTALCGSRRYPVRDPFFMMLRRSLNTFMNAFTSSDWTAYPFATQNRKDFNNLLQVYLDATFFPNLHQLDFCQEGHRLEFSQSDNPDSELVRKGIVFNEMKGSMSSPLRQLNQLVQSHLFPTTTYHYNSGGDPSCIPELTHEQLKAFHASHYHPSNAVFMTYGNFPVTEHQAIMQQQVLQHFSKTTKLKLQPEQRFTQAQNVNATYPLDDADTSQKTHIVLSWLLQNSANIKDVLNGHLLGGILLDNSASPLYHALESTDLGLSPSSLCGFSNHTYEATFSAGLEGSEPEHATAVEELIMQVLQQVAQDGVAESLIESILHQIEFQQREITGDHFPYGLQLMLQALSPKLYGGDAVDFLDIDKHLQALRADCANPNFIKQLIQEQLLDNPHRVLVTMQPDTKLAAQQLSTEKANLAAIQQQLTQAEKQAILHQAKQLEARQQQVDNADVLPTLTLEDVPDDIHIPHGQNINLANIPATWFDAATNGIIYQRVIIDLPQLDANLLNVLPLFCDAITELGYADKDYRQAAEWQNLVTGGLSASLSIRPDIGDSQTIRALFSLSSKALVRNQNQLVELLHQVLTAARFDELSHLREIISQIRTDMDNSITNRGHVLAATAASSQLNPCAYLTHNWQGLGGINSIRLLDASLKQDSALQELADKFKQIQALLLKSPMQLLAIGETEQKTVMEQLLTAKWSDFAPVPNSQNLQLQIPQLTTRQAWLINTQVNFCAKAYPVVESAHEDAAALWVLGNFLRNGFLHQRIREKGGAYGGGASYHTDSASFRFYSYRDPRLTETLCDFDLSIDWLLQQKHSKSSLEEAILGIISQIDHPSSPAGEANSAFFSNLHGRTADYRRQLRKRILAVSISDMQQVAEKYLRPEQANIAVLSNANNKQILTDLDLEICSLEN